MNKLFGEYMVNFTHSFETDRFCNTYLYENKCKYVDLALGTKRAISSDYIYT